MVAAANRRGGPDRARDEGERDEQGLRELGRVPGAPVLREWSAGSAAGRRPRGPDGEIAIYAARGTIEVDVNGTIHELSEGDTLYFDGTTPHRLRRTGGTNTRAVIVATA